ncbi:MAG: PilT/PilU family type 4a pilus ATPase [Lachnospiraceae bacterium]|nr:PilT/PilU family type 4a pilus ATPase [Lachnospiraceae bacterium]MDD7049117.1 PilT/PilU family type 4a pilus ATPase [Lachnospiraceae bacterium]
MGLENIFGEKYITVQPSLSAGIFCVCREFRRFSFLREKNQMSGRRKQIRGIYTLADNRDISRLITAGDDDFSFAMPGLSRFRVSAYKQRGSLSAVIRVVAFVLPDPSALGIPDSVIRTGMQPHGMVLVTGPAGSGKSTTLACIINAINESRRSHIITLEDPIEFLHRHKNSIVSQREINVDTESYVMALRAALRQSPDVILLGEMRDYETISVAMTAAETGHLVFSTLHTIGASNTINRIIDVFPADQQRQIAVQLSTVLMTVISQQLVPSTDGGRVPAFEIMTMNPAIRNMVRDNKVYQIDGVLYGSAQENMISMDNSLLALYRQGRITKETALAYSENPEMMGRKL